MRRALDVVRGALLGQDPRNIGATWHRLFRAFTYLGSRGLATTIISGIDIALWDLRGKALGEPVYRLLEGPIRDAVLLYGHADPQGMRGDHTETNEQLAQRARALVDQGYTALKTDPFDEMWARHTDYVGGNISRAGIRRAADLVGSLRDAVGPDIEILIDAHGAFNVPSAVACMEAIAEFGITWFEEPVPPESIAALRQVKQRATIDLCVGERLFTRWDVMPVLEEGLASFLMPDVCWTGGISEMKRIASMAEVFAVPVAPHNALGPIQILAGAHAMLTVPNFYRLEIHTDWLEQYDDCLSNALDIRSGSLVLSERPGLGAELDPAYLREFGVSIEDDERWLDTTP